MIEIALQTEGRTHFLDVTAQVVDSLGQRASADGVVVVFNPHTTAGLTINEGADPDVVADLTGALERLAPWQDGYRHVEGNAAAHIKAGLMGSSVTVPVVDGRLQLGTWQKIWFCDFDGPRRRRLWVQHIG